MNLRYAENPLTQKTLADRHIRAGGDHVGCYQRVCQVCGKTFYAGMPHANVCSQRCRQTITLQRRHARQRLARHRQCPRCGGAFVAARKDTIYCSNACRQAMHRRHVAAGRRG